ncbi:unnamed protein product [Amaranthus hypochondriacus]
MGPNPNIIYIIISIFIFFTTSISAFNITHFLDNHKEYSTFNNLLIKTNLSTKINSLGTVTVLVLSNPEADLISGSSQFVLDSILRTHVILDYYDVIKLQNMVKSANATNLFQKTGQANGQQGITHISKVGEEIVFSSAVKGAPQESKMVKVVGTQPFNIAVIEISKPVVTPGLDQVKGAPSAAPKAAAPTSPPPAKKADVPPSSPPEDEKGDAPEPSDDSEAVTPNGAGPGPAPQGGDEADSDTPAKMTNKNGGGRLSVGGVVCVALMGLVALATGGPM